MKKEDLIKLAGIAKKDYWESKDTEGESDGQGVYFNNPDHKNFYQWQPHKSIAQAFECLDKYDYFISRYKTLLEGEPCPYFEVDIEIGDKIEYTAMAENLPEAICQAVLKAQGEG